jgi:hypothetical protein
MIFCGSILVIDIIYKHDVHNLHLQSTLHNPGLTITETVLTTTRF